MWTIVSVPRALVEPSYVQVIGVPLASRTRNSTRITISRVLPKGTMTTRPDLCLPHRAHHVDRLRRRLDERSGYWRERRQRRRRNQCSLSRRKSLSPGVYSPESLAGIVRKVWRVDEMRK